MILESIITCPECGHSETETMSTNVCQWAYDCKNCATILKPKSGDCCVYCSYGSMPCPSNQGVDDILDAFLNDEDCDWLNLMYQVEVYRREL